ncbi:MAG TPA: CARDB domain-containing protein [Chloroflexota bacterium]|nr:CARDB domain-containing protein [Chloroflexota bacterium]
MRHSRSHRVTAIIRTIAVGLALIFPLLTEAGAPTRALADEPIVRDHRDPDARIQVVLKQVHIFDDEDTIGEGEIHLLAIVTECVDAQCVWQCAVPNDYCIADGPIYSQALMNFGANSGDRVNLGDRVMPRADDAVFAATRAALGVSDETGIPLHVGKHYQFGVLGWENDVGPFDFDTLGYFSVDLDESNGWGTGSDTRIGFQNDGTPGDFEMTFEIRRTPLPDLVPQSIQGQLLDDGRPIVCTLVANVGEQDSGDFQMVLRADGADIPSGTFGGPRLAVGEKLSHCFLVAAGQHRYTLSVDESHQVAEMNEYNNTLDQAVALRLLPAGGVNTLTGPISVAPEAPTGVQPITTAEADLTVESIRVKGKEPSGQNDCDPGKNDITVTVKNEGTAAAAAFVVRLLVDDDASVKNVPNLDPGKGTSVEFGGVQLKKGERKLAATVDPQKLVAESNDDNNELKITARCKDEGDD